jgi:hypothetical protein
MQIPACFFGKLCQIPREPSRRDRRGEEVPPARLALAWLLARGGDRYSEPAMRALNR